LLRRKKRPSREGKKGEKGLRAIIEISMESLGCASKGLSWDVGHKVGGLEACEKINEKLRRRGKKRSGDGRINRERGVVGGGQDRLGGTIKLLSNAKIGIGRKRKKKR